MRPASTGLWFVPTESFFGYCEATRHYVEHSASRSLLQRQTWHLSGQPGATLLSNGFTQFGRAMQELDIQIICANSPQAKGRVERANQTLQDRLVKELRLRDISDSKLQCLPAEFREDINRRFAVAPRSSTMPIALAQNR